MGCAVALPAGPALPWWRAADVAAQELLLFLPPLGIVHMHWRLATHNTLPDAITITTRLPVQVIKSELFDQNLVALLAAVNRRWGLGLAQ